MINVDPHNLLDDVHPDLAKVIRAAPQTPIGFVVDYGIRTMAEEQAAIESGHSDTLHSRHLPQLHENGKSCAVDVYVEGAEGQPDWTVADANGGKYGLVAQQIKLAAATLGIPIEWGGDKVGAWTPGVISNFRDWGHFQLPWEQYP